MANLNEIADKALAYIKEKSVDKADFTVYESSQQEITIRGEEFYLFRTLFSGGINVRVINDSRKGTANINKLDDEAVKSTIDDAIAAAVSGDADENYDIAPGLEPESFVVGNINPEIERLMERIKEFAGDVKNRHPKVKLLETFANYYSGKSVFCNTNGTRDENTYGHYELQMEFAGNDGDKSTGVFFTAITFKDLEKPLIEMADLDKQLTDAENSLDPIKVSDKFEGDIILTPFCARQFIESSLWGFTGDGAIISGTSLWIDKMDKQVAAPIVTISSKPWDERIATHEVHTSDGFRSEDYTIVEKGILKSFSTSLYAANKCKVARAKNSSLNIIVEPGDKSFEEMVKGVKRGLIVGSVSCGAPGANGELSGVAKNSFYVEDGEIKGAVTETMINGNLAEMFLNITELSKETVEDGGNVYPYIKIGKIVISGN